MKVEGTKELPATREVVWEVINDPAQMASLMPGVESFEIIDERHWTAKVKVPLGLGGLKMTMNFEKLEERPPEFASHERQGHRRRRDDEHDDVVHADRVGGRDVDGVGGRRQDRRPRRRDGPAGAAADRQPAGRKRAHRARAAGARRAAAG